MNVPYTIYTHDNTEVSLFDLERVHCRVQNSFLSPWHVDEASRVTTAPKLTKDGNRHSLSEAATASTALFTDYLQQASHHSQSGSFTM
jgi:hypothetical protein